MPTVDMVGSDHVTVSRLTFRLTHFFLMALLLPFRIHTLLATGTPFNPMIVHLLVIIATFHLWTDPLGHTVFTSTY
jgi:hypothetical protein